MPGRRTVILFVCFAIVLGVGAAAADDSPKAAETRKKLSTKIDVDYSDTTLTDVIDDLKEKVSGLGVTVDAVGGVSRNLKITYKAKQKSLADVLDGMFQKNGCGYIVVSQPGAAYDGNIKIKQGKERGYLVGEEPTKADPKAAKDDSTKATKKAATPPKTKEVTGSDSADTPEQLATRKLRLAKDILKDGKKERAKERLQEIVDKFPDTKAAEEARQLLKDMSL